MNRKYNNRTLRVVSGQDNAPSQDATYADRGGVSQERRGGPLVASDGFAKSHPYISKALDVMLEDPGNYGPIAYLWGHNEDPDGGTQAVGRAVLTLIIGVVSITIGSIVGSLAGAGTFGFGLVGVWIMGNRAISRAKKKRIRRQSAALDNLSMWATDQVVTAVDDGMTGRQPTRARMCILALQEVFREIGDLRANKGTVEW